MVTTVNGAAFGSITHINAILINNILSYMGSTFSTPPPDYMYVGGGFVTYKQPLYTRVLRTDLSGSVDTTFNMGSTGANNNVLCMVTQSDGKILMGGLFLTYSGSSSPYIVRVNTNGTRDTTFNVGTGFTGTPNAITMQSDGKFIVVGNMTNYSGSSITRILRINTNGTRDLTYNSGTGLSNTAYSIAIQSDDEIIVGGDFTTYSGSSVNRLVKINTDGTRDLSFSPGTSQNGGIYTLELLSNNSLLVAGAFTSYSGSTANRLVKINSNGSRDNSFVVGTGPSGWGSLSVGAISLDKNSKPYIASNFTTYSGSYVGHIAKLNISGSLDTTLNTGNLIFNGTGTGFNTLPYAILNIIT